MTDFNFKYYGKVDVTPAQQALEERGMDWDSYNFRQKTFDVHKETQTIPLIWNEQDFFTIKYWENYQYFKEVLSNIQEQIESELQQKGKLYTAILIRMKPGTQITPHYDRAPFFKISRRIHIPIFTNTQCLFTVSDETIHMKAGEIWEINNDGKLHGVVNNGDTDRVHLLVDWKSVDS